MIDQVTRSARERGLRVLHAAGREFDSRPYLPFVSVLGEGFETVVRSTEIVETEVWASASDELSAGSNNRTIVVVDDTQWLDSPSFRLLHYLLAAANPRVSIAIAGRAVSTARKTLPSQNWESLEGKARQQGALPIQLGEFTLAELETLVVRHIPSISVTRRRNLARELLDASGGLPAIATRLLESTDGPTHQIPESSGTHGLAWFVAELPQRDYAIALAAAVLGSGLSYPELAALTNVSDEELLDALDVLAQHGALISDSVPGRMSFPHALVRGAILAAATPEDVRQLQKAAAEIVASPHRRAQLLEASMQTQDPQLVALAARTSADSHLKSGAVTEAVRAYEVADRLDPAGSGASMLARWAGARERDGLDGSDLRQRAFDQAMNDGSLETALDAATSGLPEAERPSGEPDRIALLEEIDGTLLGGRSRFVHAATLSRQYAIAGRSDDALKLVDTAAQLVETDSDRDTVARAKWLASFTTTSPALRLTDPGFYPAGELPDSARLLTAIDQLGQGDVDRAEQTRSEIADVLDPASDPVSFWHGLMFKSTLAVATGKKEEARVCADDAFDFGSIYGVREAGGAWLAQRFVLRWMFEERGAANFLDELEDVGNIDVEETFFARTTLALAMHQGGNVEDARNLAADLAAAALEHRSYIGIGTIAMCARILGAGAPHATEMIDMLTPLAGSLIVLGSGFISLGPADLAIAHLCEGQMRVEHLNSACRFTTERDLTGWTQLLNRERHALVEGTLTGN